MNDQNISDSLRHNQMAWQQPSRFAQASMTSNTPHSNLPFQYRHPQGFDYGYNNGQTQFQHNSMVKPRSPDAYSDESEQHTVGPVYQHTTTKAESVEDLEWPMPHPDMAKTTDRDGTSPYLHLKEFPKALHIIDNPHADDETMFRDHDMAADFRASLGEGQGTDPTIPKTPQAKRTCVKLLFKAFKSVALATDNAPMLDAFIHEKHNNLKVEAMCWDLLTAMIRRSENGPLLKAYDERKVVQNPDLPTFAARLDAVVAALTEQKTICKHLFDAPYINTFVDDPKKASSRVKSNRDLNAKKGVIMTKGKELLGTDKAPQTPAKRRKVKKASDSDSEDETADGSPYLFSPESPPARARSSRRPTRATRSAAKVVKSAESDSADSPATKKDRIVEQVASTGPQQATISSTRPSYGNANFNRTAPIPFPSQYGGGYQPLYGGNADQIFGNMYAPLNHDSRQIFGQPAGGMPFPQLPLFTNSRWTGLMNDAGHSDEPTHNDRFTYNGRSASPALSYLHHNTLISNAREEFRNQLSGVPGCGPFPQFVAPTIAENADEKEPHTSPQ